MTTLDQTRAGPRMRRTRSLGMAAALLLGAASAGPLLLPATARADHDINTPFTGTRPFQLEFHGGFTWYGLGVVGGARFGIPIVQNGFVSSIDNAVYLNFGLDTYWVRYRAACGGGGCFDDYAFALGIPVALHWEFYFSDMWSAFGEIGFQFFIPPGLFRDNRWDYDGGWIGHWVVAAVGGSLHLGDAFALTVRLGNPYLSFGVDFYF